MRQIILDTETTGLQPAEGHRIIEIGCIELNNRRFTGKRYHQFINPQREVEEGALAVHGITNQFLQDKPTFIEIVDEFMQFIQGAELIIHNAPFDVGFINHELKLTRQNWKSLSTYCQIVDSLAIARQLHMGQRNSLDALCKRYSVDNSNREFHGALLDAHLLAQVYLVMTGGQSSLFTEIQMTEKTAATAEDSLSIKQVKRQLVILKANTEETIAHDAMLEKMKAKGECVWLEE